MIRTLAGGADGAGMASTYEAVMAAGADQRAVFAALEAQPLPYILDRSEGFLVQLPPRGPGGERFLRIVLGDGTADARLHDAVDSAATFVEDAVVDRIEGASWADVEAFMRRAGVALHAKVGPKPAALALEGNALVIREVGARGKVGKPRASIRFCSPRRSVLVEATLHPAGTVVAGLHWVKVEHALTAHGVTLKPVLLG